MAGLMTDKKETMHATAALPQKRTGPRQVCSLLLLSFLLRTTWLAWYYFADTEADRDDGGHSRNPLVTLEASLGARPNKVHPLT